MKKGWAKVTALRQAVKDAKDLELVLQENEADKVLLDMMAASIEFLERRVKELSVVKVVEVKTDLGDRWAVVNNSGEVYARNKIKFMMKDFVWRNDLVEAVETDINFSK